MKLTTTSVAALLAGAFGCSAPAPQAAGSIQKSEFGKAGGKTVHLYTLTNSGGLVAKIISYGTILVEMHVPDRAGKKADIVLGYDTLAPYLARHPYFGCTAGRIANRIAKGKFTLDGKEYTVATNNAPNHLHGGVKGFDQFVWESESMESADGPAVKFWRVSPDGEEGYPGKLTATVIYTLTQRNELRIEMSATTEAPTVVNLAHHTYWNLAGHGSGDVLGQELTIQADRYTPTDDTLIPTGKFDPVAGTPYDFRSAKKLGRDIDAFKKGFTLEKRHPSGGGFDTNFVVNGNPGALRTAARLADPVSGRVMELSTNEPGVQLYTGNWLNAEKGKGGATYNQHGGVCLETQKHPDSVNKPDWPSAVLRPGQRYHHVMVHRFSTH